MCLLVSFMQTESDIYHFPGVDSHTVIRRRARVTDGQQALNWLLAVAPHHTIPFGSTRRLLADPHTQTTIPDWFGQSDGRKAERFATEVAGSHEGLLGYLGGAADVDLPYLLRTVEGALPRRGCQAAAFEEACFRSNNGDSTCMWLALSLQDVIDEVYRGSYQRMSRQGMWYWLHNVLVDHLRVSGAPEIQMQEFHTHPERYGVLVRMEHPTVDRVSSTKWADNFDLRFDQLRVDEGGDSFNVRSTQPPDVTVAPITADGSLDVDLPREIVLAANLVNDRIYCGFGGMASLRHQVGVYCDFAVQRIWPGQAMVGELVRSTWHGHLIFRVNKFELQGAVNLTELDVDRCAWTVDREAADEPVSPEPTMDTWVHLFSQRKHRIDEWKDPQEITIDYSQPAFAA